MSTQRIWKEYPVIEYLCFECGKVEVDEAAALCRECEKAVFGE